MIRYRLRCGAGHEFEAWFASSDGYEQQEAQHLLSCPSCSSTDVSRAIMAPNIGAAGRGKSESAIPDAPQHPAASNQLTPESERLRTMMREMRSLRDQILAKSEYVGPRFAEEARRIHFEEAPDRAIHGEATADDVKSLADDGVDVMPLPQLPDDQN